MSQGKAREFVWEFQGNLGLNFDLCKESMALESGNTVGGSGNETRSRRGSEGLYNHVLLVIACSLS